MICVKCGTRFLAEKVGVEKCAFCYAREREVRQIIAKKQREQKLTNVKNDLTVRNKKRRKADKALKRLKRKKKNQTKDRFYESWAWTTLRYKVLQKYGAKCMCCGATKEDGAVIQVDHVKPRHKYPELELDFDNQQVLCKPCNRGKGAWDETDFRPKGR